MECPSTMQGRTTIWSCGRCKSSVRNASSRGCCVWRLSNSNSQEADEATEDEAMNDEPSYAFAKGYGRFGIGCTRQATALGNFEQGDIDAESAVVAQWLTFGLRIAMSRTGWNLISTRYSLTKVLSPVLSGYYSKGILSLRRWRIVLAPTREP